MSRTLSKQVGAIVASAARWLLVLIVALSLLPFASMASSLSEEDDDAPVAESALIADVPAPTARRLRPAKLVARTCPRRSYRAAIRPSCVATKHLPESSGATRLRN